MLTWRKRATDVSPITTTTTTTTTSTTTTTCNLFLKKKHFLVNFRPKLFLFRPLTSLSLSLFVACSLDWQKGETRSTKWKGAKSCHLAESEDNELEKPLDAISGVDISGVSKLISAAKTLLPNFSRKISSSCERERHVWQVQRLQQRPPHKSNLRVRGEGEGLNVQIYTIYFCFKFWMQNAIDTKRWSCDLCQVLQICKKLICKFRNAWIDHIFRRLLKVSIN